MSSFVIHVTNGIILIIVATSMEWLCVVCKTKDCNDNEGVHEKIVVNYLKIVRENAEVNEQLLQEIASLREIVKVLQAEIKTTREENNSDNVDPTTWSQIVKNGKGAPHPTVRSFTILFHRGQFWVLCFL